MPTILKILLAERRLGAHSDFLAAYDRYAAQLDPPVPPGYGPAKAQFYQWLSGRMVGLPRDYHRRVLSRMFPDWTVEGLFQVADTVSVDRSRAHRSAAAGSDLEAFLGVDIVTCGVTLVYSARGADPAAVTEEDLRGLLPVHALLERHTDIAVDVRADHEPRDAERPYIGFGVVCARDYADGVDKPLFRLRMSGAGADSGLLELGDGTRFRTTGERHIGAVARIRPVPYRYPDRCCFLCAGPSPGGTAGAGRFLAEHWPVLHRHAGGREFVAVVSVRVHSDRHSRLEKLLLGR